jgi:hypothetical protein
MEGSYNRSIPRGTTILAAASDGVGYVPTARPVTKVKTPSFKAPKTIGKKPAMITGKGKIKSAVMPTGSQPSPQPTAMTSKRSKKKLRAGGPGSGRKAGNGLDKTHQWSQSKVTGEHLLKSKGGPVGQSAGTYARVGTQSFGSYKVAPDKEYKAETFGNAKGTSYHPSLDEAKDAAEKRFASTRNK